MIHVALLGDQWGKTIKPLSLKGEPGMNLGCPWKVEARLGLISVADTEEESISKTQFNPQKMKCFPIGLEEVTGSLEDPAQYLLCQHIYFPLMAISPRKACLLFGKWVPGGEKLTAQVPAKNEKGPWFQCHHPGAMFKCLLLKNYSSIEEKVSSFEGLQRTKETYGWSCWKVDFGLGSRGPPPKNLSALPLLLFVTQWVLHPGEVAETMGYQLSNPCEGKFHTDRKYTWKEHLNLVIIFSVEQVAKRQRCQYALHPFLFSSQISSL